MKTRDPAKGVVKSLLTSIPDFCCIWLAASCIARPVFAGVWVCGFMLWQDQQTLQMSVDCDYVASATLFWLWSFYLDILHQVLSQIGISPRVFWLSWIILCTGCYWIFLIQYPSVGLHSTCWDHWDLCSWGLVQVGICAIQWSQFLPASKSWKRSTRYVGFVEGLQKLTVVPFIHKIF